MEDGARNIRAVLKWISSYTKTDMVYLAKGGFWLTLGQGFAAISAFTLSVLFANFLSQEVYGTYKYALSLASLFAIPTLGGISVALQRAIARGEGGARAALRARLLGGVGAAVGALAGAAWYVLHGNYDLALVLVIIAIGVPLMEAYGTYEAIFQGKGKFGSSTASFVISSIAATLALATSIFLFKDNFFALLIAYFGTWTLARFSIWRYALRFVPNESTANNHDVVGYGFRLSLIRIVSSIAGQIDKVLLFHYLGPVQLAIYSFALAIPDQLKAVTRNIGPLALSKFSSRTSKDILSSIHKKAVWSILFSVPIVALYILCAPFIFSILFPNYLAAVLPSQIFSISILVTPVFLYNAALQAQKSERLIAVTDISLNVVQIILSLILIPFYGLWGAIIARVIGRFLGAIVLGFSVRYM